MANTDLPPAIGSGSFSAPPSDGRSAPHPGGPVVVGANWFRFAPGQRISHGRVDGVSFLWAQRGSGTVTSRSETFPLSPGSVLRLPWRHDVEYRADPRAPFSLGTLHLLPWHDAGVPIDPRVAHLPGDPLLDAPYRHGSPAIGSPHLEPPALLPETTAAARNIVTLGAYAIDRFLAQPGPDEASLRSLGILVAEESDRWFAEPGAAGVPAALQVMLDHIGMRLQESLTIAEVAASAGCSEATAQRLFSRYTGLSVLAWIRRRRMDEAALLLRTTSLRVGEVARLVGYPDPLYFSRVFASAHGVPPSRYSVAQLRP